MGVSGCGSPRAGLTPLPRPPSRTPVSIDPIRPPGASPGPSRVFTLSPLPPPRSLHHADRSAPSPAAPDPLPSPRSRNPLPRSPPASSTRGVPRPRACPASPAKGVEPYPAPESVSPGPRAAERRAVPRRKLPGRAPSLLDRARGCRPRSPSVSSSAGATRAASCPGGKRLPIFRRWPESPGVARAAAGYPRRPDTRADCRCQLPRGKEVPGRK